MLWFTRWDQVGLIRDRILAVKTSPWSFRDNRLDLEPKWTNKQTHILRNSKIPFSNFPFLWLLLCLTSQIDDHRKASQNAPDEKQETKVDNFCRLLMDTIVSQTHWPRAKIIKPICEWGLRPREVFHPSRSRDDWFWSYRLWSIWYIGLLSQTRK